MTPRGLEAEGSVMAFLLHHLFPLILKQESRWFLGAPLQPGCSFGFGGMGKRGGGRPHPEAEPLYMAFCAKGRLHRPGSASGGMGD